MNEATVEQNSVELSYWKTFLRALVLIGVVFVPLSWILDSARSSLILLAALLLIAIVLKFVTGRKSVALHVVTAILAVAQFWIVDSSRDQTHIGVAWFLLIPCWSALIGKSQHIIFWYLGTCGAIVLCWLRARPDDILWQHPMTLPNLLGITTVLTLIARGVIRERDRKEIDLQQQSESARREFLIRQQAQKDTLKAQQTNRRILASLTHDLKTPLTGIRLLVDESEQDAASLQQNQKSLKALADRAEQMLGDVLALARLNLSDLNEDRTTFPLLAVVEGAARQVKSQADAAESLLVVDVPPCVPAFRDGHPALLRQLLVMLLSNSLKATSSGAVRMVVAEKSSEQLTICIEDSGTAVPDGQRSDLFKRLGQHHDDDAAPDSVRRGIGLGLTIAQDLAEFLGGTLVLDEQQQGVTRFVLTVKSQAVGADLVGDVPDAASVSTHPVTLKHCHPWIAARVRPWLEHWHLCESDRQGTVHPELRDMKSTVHISINELVSCLSRSLTADQNLETGPTGLSSKPCSAGVFHLDQRRSLARTEAASRDVPMVKHLLLVEDDAMVLKALNAVCRSLGVETGTARSGIAALQSLRTDAFDMAIMDVNMPGISGLETLKQIRSDPQIRGDLQVFLMSGSSEVEAQAMAAGATGFLLKPLSRAGLRQLLCVKAAP